MMKALRKKYFLILIFTICLSMVLTACRLWTVVELKEKSEDGIDIYFVDEDFSPADYVDSIWVEKALPYIDENKVELIKLIEELGKDVNAAGEKYGSGSAVQGDTWNFIVKGKGKVVKIHTESRAGIMDVDLPPYDNKTDVKIQIGPVIKYYSIRDSLDFVKLDDFKNQIEFAQISNEINKRVCDDVLKDMDFNSMEGSEIDFLGAFTYMSLDNIVITPLKLELAGGDKS